jgi:GT2 family glycosyltransferase
LAGDTSSTAPSIPGASVVIPTRNRRAALERAIRSVVAQTFADWELIVVDDASMDDTWEFLEGLDDPRIHIVRLEQHRERSAARNRGLRAVSSPAALFLDDDDQLVPSALELLTAALAHHPTAGASVGAVIHEIDGARTRPPFPKRPHLLDVRLELLAGWVALGGQSLIRTALLDEAGGWPEELSVAEDQELWLRLCTKGPTAIVPEAVLVHHPHGLAGDAPENRDVERSVVARHLGDMPGADGRARRAAAAREHLRDSYVAFQSGAYRTAVRGTLRGIGTAPFLLISPLVGPGLLRAVLGGVLAAVLPRTLAERMLAVARRRRAPSSARG